MEERGTEGGGTNSFPIFCESEGYEWLDMNIPSNFYRWVGRGTNHGILIF